MSRSSSSSSSNFPSIQNQTLDLISLALHLRMEFSAADFDRLMMVDLARNACEEQYKKDPLDSEVCTI